ncbi:unnamed protein product, partial [Discosporangium mesarthrocarpum]
RGKKPTAEERNNATYWYNKFTKKNEDFNKLVKATMTTKEETMRYVDDLHWEIAQLQAKVEVLEQYPQGDRRAIKGEGHRSVKSHRSPTRKPLPHMAFLRGFDLEHLLGTENTVEVKNALFKLHQLVVSMSEELESMDNTIQNSKGTFDELIALCRDKDEKLDEWEAAYNELVAQGQLEEWEGAIDQVVSHGQEMIEGGSPSQACLEDLAGGVAANTSIQTVPEVAGTPQADRVPGDLCDHSNDDWDGNDSIPAVAPRLWGGGEEGAWPGEEGEPGHGPSSPLPRGKDHGGQESQREQQGAASGAWGNSHPTRYFW